MKKNVLPNRFLLERRHNKILLVMKLTVAAVVLLVSQVFANSASPQKTITLKLQNTPIKKVFAEIENKTVYRFVFNDDIIPVGKNVDLDANNEAVNNVLDRILVNTNLTYKFPSETVIVITSKNAIAANAPAVVKVITGRIINDRGEPLSGASIKVKGANKGVVSDANGEFKIQLDDAKEKIIVITYSGYIQQEVITASIKSPLNIRLLPLVENLDDVVILGYTSVRKRDVTVSVSKVDVGELQKAPVISFDQALAGRAAGVQVVSQDGQPGAPINIVIRGNNSLTQDNSPLYVIDGFPIENPDPNTINVAEIESLEILKDASATAVYGARAANGVILITTKKGKIGVPVVELQAYTSSQKVLKRIELMNPYEYVKYLYDLNPVNTLTGYLRNVDNNPKSVDSVLNLYKNVRGLDLQDAVFGAPAPFSNYYLSIRGGNEKTKYNLSGNFADQKGIMVNSGFKRYQLKFNIDQTISNALKIGLNSTYTYTDQYGVQPVGSGNSGLAGGTSYLMASVWGYRPINVSGNIDSLLEQMNDASIDPTNTSQLFNPLFSTRNEYHKNFQANIFVNGYLDYRITPHWKLRMTAGINQTNGRREDFYNSQTSRGRINATNVNGVNGNYSHNITQNITNENTLNYNNTFNRIHRLNVLVGFTNQSVKTNFYSQGATNIPNESLVIAGLSQGIAGVPVVDASSNTLVSFLSQFQYDYKSKYLVTASFRSDGSSKFSKDKRWSYFPAFSVAWRLSNEPFMKQIKVVTDAKVRFGYGVTGNNRIGDFSTYSSLAGGYSPVNNTFLYIANLGRFGNKDLKWETTAQSNLGLDIELWKGKIGLTVDLYRKVTSDLLLNANLPTSSGFSSVFKNIGKTRNQGLEIQLNTVNMERKNFNWTTSFNISFNQTRVLELAENQEVQYSTVGWNGNYNSTPLYIAKKGGPLGEMFGFVSDGIYQYSDFDRSSTGAYTLKTNVPTSFTTRLTQPNPGAVKLKDLNGDGIINNSDRTVIGSGLPIHIGGITNTFKIHDFDASIFFQWSYGNDIYNANRLIFENGSPNSSLSYLNMYKSYTDRWSPSNQTNDMPSANPGALPGNYYWSRVVEDGSYIRLKTLSIGYSLPAKIIKRLGNPFKRLRVYTAMQNLLTWTNYTGFDPEVNGRPTALTPGFDFSVYPRANTITFGANLTF